jgi:hypothetical protein
MKRQCKKRVLSLLMALCVIISVLPLFTIVVCAEETGYDTSMEIAGGWGFDTSRPENSQKREALGENPMGAKEDTVTIFGEVPLEIAIAGGRISNAPIAHNKEDRGDIYCYDGMEAVSYVDHLFYKKIDEYNNVNHISFSGEPDVRPATTIAADINGDGIDEILRYYIEINYDGSEGKPDGDIGNFNAGIEGYSADFNLQCINSQTGAGMGRIKLRSVSKKDIPDFFIPDSTYYWSSYLQMTAGDYDGDGKDEVALVVPGQLTDTGKSQSSGNIYIFGISPGPVGVKFDLEYSSNNLNHYSLFGDQDFEKKYTAFHLATGDADNDKIDELVYTYTRDVLTVDEESYIGIIDYKDGAYTSSAGKVIKFGNGGINEHPVGNAGVTVGDINNDGLNEVVIGGYMVNKNEQGALYTFTNEFGETKKFEFYHELAMSYMEFDKASETYGNFKGFTVLRDEEDMAWTAAGGNDTRYNGSTDRRLSNSGRFRNAKNWTLPIQSVSLTGYVNGRTNDQVFFGNCMYYYNAGSGKFEVYDDGGKADDSIVAYKSFSAPNSSINALIPGSFLDSNKIFDTTGTYIRSEGREQLLVSYAFDSVFEFALMYESSAGTSMDVQKKHSTLARAEPGGFNQLGFYPTVCAPNMDNDAVFVQYIDYAFTYSKPEVLTVLASIPYYEDIYNSYPWSGWEPGSTYLGKSSGSSQTATGFTEFSLGCYLSFEQDISVLGLKIASIEMEQNFTANTSYEFSYTIERESSVEYETNGGQDSVVLVSSPLDMYYYRYYEESSTYKAKYPHAAKSDPSTWGIMAVSLPGAPQVMVFPVESYNELADVYGMDKIDENFWMHTQGDPGTYPTSVDQFKNASNILSSDSSISATFGSGSISTELSITESTGHAFTFSFTLEARVGAGAGGGILGATFSNTTGFGGAVTSFNGTTIGASLSNFPTTGYSLTTRLHSYTTEFNDKDIMVLYYTVSNVRGLPKLPSSFYMAGRTAGSITLGWDVPEVISYALKPNRYKLYRYDNYYKEWILLDDNVSLETGTNYYTDTDVFPNVAYEYKLVALDITGAKTNSVTLEASTVPIGDLPIIIAQPRDTTAGAGQDAFFSIDAELPENVDPSRLYYQWYRRGSEDDSWSAISGANGKTLVLSSITPDMNGYEYYCEVTRLINNIFPLSAESANARLTVAEQPPGVYAVSYSAGINGSVTAFEIGAGGNYEINSGSLMFERTKVEFKAEPNIGYRVNQWTINGEAVAGNTGNTLTIGGLSGDISVSVSFTYSTYNITFDIAENVEEGQNGAVWGSISARYADAYVLPQGEATSVAAQAPITFTMVPAIIGGVKYTVKQWTVNGEIVKNDNGSTFIGNTYIIEALSEDTVVEAMFAKAVEYKIEVSSQISNTDVAYYDTGSIVVRDDGVPVQPGDPIEKGSKVTINVTPPVSALIYSWEITPVDADGEATAPSTVLGSQASYIFDELSSSYKLKIIYVIVSTKTVTFGSEGGSGSVTAVAGAGNTEPTGVVANGGKVQMYSDIVFTAHPDDEVLGVKGWKVNGVYETSTATSYTLEDINRNTTIMVLFEAAPMMKNFYPDGSTVIDIKAEETALIEADAIALDVDGDSLAISGISTPPAEGIANAMLGEGVNHGKAVITGVNKGSTSTILTVSDGKGHDCNIVVEIRVSNNPQSIPVGLIGIAPTVKNGSDGKITGLVAGKTYQYKAAVSTDYTTIVAEEYGEIEGLAAGTYLVRFAAVTGHDASKAVEVEVPQYVPRSIAGLDALSYKVGGSEETAVTGFDGNVVTYNVKLDSDVEDGTEIVLSGIPAEGSGAAVTETVNGTMQAGISMAKIKVTAEDETTSKAYTVNFTTGEAPCSEAKILEFKIPVDGVIAVGAINEIAKTIEVTIPKGTSGSSLTAAFILSDGAKAGIGGVEQVSGETVNDFTEPVTYTVIAEDGATTAEYTVTATAAADVISYYFLDIGVDGSCEGMGIAAGGGSYEEGGEVTITALPGEGYKFAVWEVVYGEFSLTNPYTVSTTFNMPDIDGLTINAKFAAREFPAVTPATASFDKYDDTEDDKLNKGTVSFMVNKGEYEFMGITGMTGDTDYIAEDDGGIIAITLTNDILQSLENGVHNLSFKFTGGNTYSVALEIVNSKSIVTGVLVNPATASVAQGKTKAFTAAVSGINHGNSVIWSVEGNDESLNTSISAAGVLTVDAEEAPKTLTVRAVSTVDPGKYGMAVVMVISKVDAETPVFDLNLSTDTVIYNEGESAAALYVNAIVNDGGTIGYQWYENTENSTINGTKIDGANSASYTPPTETAGTKYYYVVAANENLDATGRTTAINTSAITHVRVNALVYAAAPVITGLTGRTSYLQGDSISYDDMLKVSATVDDGGTISYKWYLKAEEGGGSDILASNNGYCIPSTSVAGTFTYYVVVTNTNNNENVTGNTTAEVTSGYVVVTVEAVIDAAQPCFTEGGNLAGTVNYPVGGQASPLTVTATAADLESGGVLSYQWYMNTIENTEGGIATGTNSASYTPDIGGLEAGTTRYYYVVVTNTNESVNGAKTRSITSGIKTVNIQDKVDAAAPVIEQQSTGVYTYYKGARANYLEVYASSGDGGTVSYQWYMNSVNNNTNGVPIEGETGRTYRPSTDAKGITYYYVAVTNTNMGVNGNQIAVTTGEVITVHIVQPELESLGELNTSITGVAYGTEANAPALGLPEEMLINISIDGTQGTDTAAITWDLSGYGTSKTAPQTFDAIGTVILPEGVLNTKEILLKVIIRVSVNGKPSGGDGGGTGGGGGGGGAVSLPAESPAETPKTGTTATGNTVTATVIITAAVDINGKAAAAVTQDQVSDIVDKAVSEAESISAGTSAGVEIKVETDAGTKLVETSIPGSSITLMAESGIKEFTVSTPVASITFGGKALPAISGKAGDVKITASKVDSSTLPDELKQTVGDRPVYDFNVTSGDRIILQFNGNVKVSVPYTPKKGEDTNAIVIYYINAEGRLEIVSNCSYDPEAGMITFKTSHFSKYVVGYNKKVFRDVTANAWYTEAVGFVSARGIALGTGGGNFDPEGKLTRGQLIVMVMRAYGIGPDENISDNFSDAGNTYYTGYLAAAKRLGISNGVGNNMYAPEREITRQEMFTLLYNALKLIGELPENTDVRKLNEFGDSSRIAGWAKDAMALFVESGTIGGSGAMLFPANTSNRAEMVQVLYKLLSNRRNR